MLKLSSQTLRWRWGAACSVPHVSGMDDACGISAHNMFLSNCVVQVMRVWSLPAVLSPLAKLHRRYGVTQPTAHRILHQVCGGRGMKASCAYIWMPFQLRRSLVAFGLDLPVMSVHGAGAYHAKTSPACNRTQHPTFHGCVHLGSAAYPLYTSQISPQRLKFPCLSVARSHRTAAYTTPIN